MRINVPPQVCSTSSGWAAIARMSSGFSKPSDARLTGANISLPLLVVARPPRRQQQNETHPDQESADVREPCHAAAGSAGVRHRTNAAEKLDGEPIQQKECGGD